MTLAHLGGPDALSGADRAVSTSSKPKHHFKGCNCRKTQCRKNYCECFQAGVRCSSLCTCDNCHNCEELPSQKLGPPSAQGDQRAQGAFAYNPRLAFDTSMDVPALADDSNKGTLVLQAEVSAR